ncbi:MAG: NAD(P)/FAD-dependent oxidoreductase [Legionella sp.]|nr:NAD(P)/FAD-dependent oxidoreductase [Legionella sp.]
MDTRKPLDCIIIGGGPAGLTSAIYLARYRRNVIVYDTFDSRAARIPLSHNYPGFPEGIAGKELLKRLRQQLSVYNVPLINAAAESLTQVDEDEFLVMSAGETQRAKNIILCTGVKDIEPHLADINDGIQKGLIRHCAVCDAYEIIDKKIAVIGEGKSGLGEALFLRDYTRDVTLMTLGVSSSWTRTDLKQIRDAEIKIIPYEILAIELTVDKAKITYSDNSIIQFDSIYSALGCIENNALAKNIKAKQKEGLLLVNKAQQTSVKGVFAAGDIVSGLNQICVATCQAAMAATAIHKRCKKT